jgi:hypothetical protein
LVADGKGHYTSGSTTEHAADDTHTGGEDLCRFTLVSGSYTVATDGRGTASTVWKLASGGDSHCANFVPGRQFAKGFSINKGLQDAPPAASTSNFLVTPNRTLLGFHEQHWSLDGRLPATSLRRPDPQ